jgi:hypothetical protein
MTVSSTRRIADTTTIYRRAIDGNLQPLPYAGGETRRGRSRSPLFYDNYGTPQVTPATGASTLPELRENCRRIAVREAKIDYVAGVLARIEAKLDGRPDLTPPRT